MLELLICGAQLLYLGPFIVQHHMRFLLVRLDLEVLLWCR